MKCQNCGKEFTSGNKCPECGAPVPEIDKPEKTKKPITKKWWFWVIIAVVVFVVLASVGGNKNDSNNSVPVDDNAASQLQTDNTTAAKTEKMTAAKTEKNKGDIGKYNIVVKDSKIVSDYEGKSLLLVTYSFTNNGEQSISMNGAIMDKAFQNGVELSPVYSDYNIDGYNYDDRNKDIQTGVTFDVKIGYYLNDSESVVNIELSEFISFSDDVLKYDIAIK